MNYTVKYRLGDLEINDLSQLLESNLPLSIDTETTGLDARVNNLELVQVACGQQVYIIKFYKEENAPNLIELLNSDSWKIFHNATFDCKFLIKNLSGIKLHNIICTKIAAKLLNGVQESSSLKTLLARYCNIYLSKDEQLSNWKNEIYTQSQIEYAVKDVLFLPILYQELHSLIVDRELEPLLNSCFQFIPIQARLELNDIENIFKY